MYIWIASLRQLMANPPQSQTQGRFGAAGMT